MADIWNQIIPAKSWWSMRSCSWEWCLSLYIWSYFHPCPVWQSCRHSSSVHRWQTLLFCCRALHRWDILGSHEKAGILMDYNNIKKNPWLRALAKLMLNSFWGKSRQRSNMPQIKYISEPAEYFDMLTSDQILVIGINFVSDEIGHLCY
jgi:hypothetical protein